MEATHNRITFIDAARCYAVFLALFSHALAANDFFVKTEIDVIYIKQFTRMATPMFVLMFGFMVEFIYTKRTELNNIGTVSKRLYIRSLQCYVAFALTSFCALLGEFISLEEFLGSLIFQSNSRFGNILRAYSVMLIITPTIIRIRLAYGVKQLYLILIALLVFHFYLPSLQSIEFGIIGKPLNILFGIGNRLGGPSVIGALIFYISGIIVASGLRPSGSDAGFGEFYKTVALLSLVLFAAGLVFIPDTPKDAWIHFADFTYRKHNALGYFIIGTLCSLAVISLFCFLIGNKEVSKIFVYIIPVGTSSLIAYTAGNVVLNLFGSYIQHTNILLFIPGFFLAVILITNNVHKIPYYDNFRRLMNLEYK
jgi:hypothetical protein